MKKESKPETRGRKAKLHKPLDASFDEVLNVLAKSKYKDEKKIKKPKKSK